MIDYWPEDVVLDGPSVFPLCDTFGHLEAECAVAILVLALASRGAGWVPVLWTDLVWTLERAERHWLRNPMYVPDFSELVDEGYAVRSMDSMEWLELTPAAIERLRRWVPR